MQKFKLHNTVGDENGITVDKVNAFLDQAAGDDIQFDISSLGGDLATAITIYDLISSYPGKTTAYITGLTASAGTVIAVACDEVVISENALFLIHNGWTEVTGNVYDFQKAASDMSKTDAIMVKLYRQKTGLPDEKIKDIMKASDWMTPDEAVNYRFVDRVEPSGMKIAASAIISSAQGKVNNQLLIKLQEKMKIFGKEKAKADVMNVLALKDGKSLLINAEVAATGVEVAPLGVATLEDGEYELADGRKIMVAGGVITEVTDPAAAPAPMESDAIIGTVASMLTASEAKIEALIEAKLKPLAAMVSTHVPPKAAGPVNPGQASMVDPLQEKIEAKQAEIKAAADKKRKGL